MASSNIEGIRAPVEAVASSQLGGPIGPAGWVADNLAVIGQVLHEPDADLDIDTLNSWHHRLMIRSTLPTQMVGALRDAQNWIGGRSPRDAVFVPPPADYLSSLMEDLVGYVNRLDLDPVVQAAVAHAQFETIHPYGDGNGRIGRVLVLWILARRLGVAVPPPMSTMIARDIGGYLSGLHWYRSGDENRWIGWFAGTLERSAVVSLEWMSEVESTIDRWHKAVTDLRKDAAARRVIEVLPLFPVISAHEAARQLGISATAARSALEALSERGVVAPYAGRINPTGRPSRLWFAKDLVDLVNGWIA